MLQRQNYVQSDEMYQYIPASHEKENKIADILLGQ